ncbi:porin [Sulfurimonas sp. SAG-AH-194-C21]|nr:porin [Sulfurimonas sp. SAG-AH-194-C21]MDF1883886.1 porin [Sulfurimonas sp. SAG-AH-194-C21]
MRYYILMLALATSLFASTIEMYGVAHLSGDSIDNGQNRVFKIASNSSRLGIRGDYDISNGMKILMQYESGVDLTGQGTDDGNGGQTSAGNTLFTRTRVSFIGIESKFGTIKAGVLSVNDRWMYDYNLFADQVGDLGNIWGKSSTFINRANDMVMYALPEIVKGLDIDVSYLTDLSDKYAYATINDAKEITGVLLKVDYKINGFKFGVGYLDISNDYDQPAPSDLALTASYTGESYSVGAGYLQSKNSSSIEQTHDSFMLGGSYNYKDFVAKTQYSSVSDNAHSGSSSMIALGVDYKLNKDALVYLAYASTNNGDTAVYKANNYGHGKSAYGTPNPGDDPSALSIGLVYKFSGTIYKK